MSFLADSSGAIAASSSTPCSKAFAGAQQQQQQRRQQQTTSVLGDGCSPMDGEDVGSPSACAFGAPTNGNAKYSSGSPMEKHSSASGKRQKCIIQAMYVFWNSPIKLQS